MLSLIISPTAVEGSETPTQNLSLSMKQWVTDQLLLTYPLAHSIETQVRLPRSSDSLPFCNTKIEFNASAVDVGRTRVRATCGSPLWSIRGTANSKVTIDALVAGQAMKKGHRLTETDFRMSRVILTTPQKSYYSNNLINGHQLKHRLRPGELITYKHIEPNYAVRKGDLVSISYVSNTFKLSTDGIAEENGVVGDLIKVHNTQSEKLLQVIVTGNQAVKLC